MKSIFKFLFNFLRNVSLVMVILTVLLVFWLSNDREFREGIMAEIEKKEKQSFQIEERERGARLSNIMPLESSKPEKRIEKEEERKILLDNIMSSENSELNENFEEEEFEMLAVEEMPFSSSISNKLRLDVKGGQAYIRPTQIMYVEAIGRKQRIMTTAEREIFTTSGMEKIKNLLINENGAYFFSTRSEIYNCNYIEQVVSESTEYKSKYSYKNWVYFENGDSLNIPGAHVNNLKERLDSLSQ